MFVPLTEIMVPPVCVGYPIRFFSPAQTHPPPEVSAVVLYLVAFTKARNFPTVTVYLPHAEWLADFYLVMSLVKDREFFFPDLGLPVIRFVIFV